MAPRSLWSGDLVFEMLWTAVGISAGVSDALGVAFRAMAKLDHYLDLAHRGTLPGSGLRCSRKGITGSLIVDIRGPSPSAAGAVHAW